MRAATKEQTAFRFEPDMIFQMKRRAKSLNLSLNKYVTNLISDDLKKSLTLPKITLPERLDEDIALTSGILREPSQEELYSDERLRRIWER